MKVYKKAIINGFTQLGLTDLSFQKKLSRPHIQILNYHQTKKIHENNIEKQLQFYLKYYNPVSIEQIHSFLKGDLTLDKPGIFLSFDDGCKSNFEVMYPLLKKYGFKAAFFIPTAYIENKDWRPFVYKHLISGCEDGDIEPSMSWENIKTLSNENYLIGCHTHNHVRFTKKVDEHKILDEITKPIEIFKQNGIPINSFCWVGGETDSYSKVAFEIIKKHYDYCFTTIVGANYKNHNPHFLLRTNVECHWNIDDIKFYLSGLMDKYYYKKKFILSKRLLQ